MSLESHKSSTDQKTILALLGCLSRDHEILHLPVGANRQVSGISTLLLQCCQLSVYSVTEILLQSENSPCIDWKKAWNCLCVSNDADVANQPVWFGVPRVSFCNSSTDRTTV